MNNYQLFLSLIISLYALLTTLFIAIEISLQKKESIKELVIRSAKEVLKMMVSVGASMLAAYIVFVIVFKGIELFIGA